MSSAEQQTREITLHDLQEVLSQISSDMPRKYWIRALIGAKHEFGEDAKEACKEWSKTSSQYNEREFNSAWKSIRNSLQSRIQKPTTINTLFYFAEKSEYSNNKAWVRPKNIVAKSPQIAIDASTDWGMADDIAYKARENAIKLFIYSPVAPENHQYFAKKGIKSHGIKMLANDVDEAPANSLIIPVYDQQMMIQGIQFIPPNEKSKIFLTGSRMKGCFSVLSSNSCNDKIYVCEGMATAATVNEITEKQTYISFGANNLCAVIPNIQILNPGTQLIIVADNDRHHEPQRNPGLDAARKAAKEFGVAYTYPIFAVTKTGKDFTDFNDLARAEGMDEAKRQLSANICKTNKTVLSNQSSNTLSNQLILSERNQRAAIAAKKLIDESQPAANDHPYLIAKKIKSHGLRVTMKNGLQLLLMPIMSFNNKIQSLQYIYPNGDEWYFPGSKISCGFHIVFGTTDTVVLCKDYASGVTIHELKKETIIICLDDLNMIEVAKNIKALFPHSKFKVAADSSKDGIKHGQKAAKILGGILVYPPEKDTNFYDYINQ